MISLSAVTFMKLVMLYSDTHVRLTGYNLTHAGRVEVFSNGVWGRVCNVWGSWRQKEAAVVCRQLGFEGVIAAFSYPSDSAQFVVMSRVQCVGNETSLQQCQHDDFVNIIPLHSCQEVGVVCKPHNFYSDDGKVSIRLQGSSLPNAGRIEILYAGVWGAISSYHWDLNDATVVCRQLGYKAGAEAALRNRVYGPFSGPVWLKNLQCIGSEKHIMECAQDEIGNKTERSPATRFASLICKDGKMSGEMKIRLRGSHQPNMGRIEVYYAGRWGAIYPWFGTSSMKKASTVVCRQLGYRGASLSGYNMFCSEAVLPWFTNLRCDGSEASLNKCDLDFYFNTSVDCMNVLCTNETTDSGYKLRLSASSVPHAGRVEIGTLGIWGSIFREHFFRDKRFSFETQRVICRLLGYNDSILGSIWMRIAPKLRPRWFRDDEFYCLGNETNIRDCIPSPKPQLTRPGSSSAIDLGVVCKPNVPQINDFQVRLVGTSLPFAGAIEVSYYGVWGAIWGHSIDVRVGRVICHQLGYSDAQQVFRKSVFGYMKSPFLVKGISCNGNESVISQCTIRTIDDRNYWYYFHPGYGAGVQCVESDQVEISKDFSVRLAGSPISNAGQVEVFYAGVWGTIDSYHWNIKNAHVVCRQLGYPGAISAGASSQFGDGERTVWFSNVRCLGSESSLQDCPKLFAKYFGGRRASTALCKLPYQPALPTPCMSSPCKNSGQCFSNNSSYLCICPVGLTGKRCEERILNENISPRKGKTEFNIYFTAISVSVIATLLVTVVCLIFKIKQLRIQQTTQAANPTKIYSKNTFQTEPVGEPLEEQRTSPTNIDSGSGYAYIDDLNVNVGDSKSDIEMSSRPLPPIPSKRAKIYRNNTFQAEPINESLEGQRASPTNTELGSGYANVDDINAHVRDFRNDVESSSHPIPRIPSKRPKRKGSLIKTRGRRVNNNPDELSPEILKLHYIGRKGNDNNKNGPIERLNETAPYMHLSPRRLEHVVYSGLNRISGETITGKQGVKRGSKTKGHAYACLQKK